MSKKLITRKEALELLHISLSTLKKLEAEGKIVGTVGLGNHKLYFEDDVNALLETICRKLDAKKDAAARLAEVSL